MMACEWVRIKMVTRVESAEKMACLSDPPDLLYARLPVPLAPPRCSSPGLLRLRFLLLVGLVFSYLSVTFSLIYRSHFPLLIGVPFLFELVLFPFVGHIFFYLSRFLLLVGPIFYYWSHFPLLVTFSFSSLSHDLLLVCPIPFQ